MENTEKAERIKRIVAKSVNLFKTYGIRSVSMDDIARELGMSKKTLYEHFDNKAELLSTALEVVLQEFTLWYDDLKEQNLNAIDELLSISKRVNDEYAKFSPSNIFDLKKYYPDVIKEHINNEKQITYTVLVENLRKGITGNIYRNDLDVDLIAGLYVQKIAVLHSGEFWSDANVTFEKIFEIMFENHIRGIVNPEGLEYFEQRKSQLIFKNLQ
ncbi:MAG: TetR/AcrR family transcriptional regulator [Bacteroidales bacterium]|nr:TetR/AcrR family transcriptional regulator [Bacteroidales bacterium]